MSIQVIPKERQARGAFNGGEIIENKPIGFPREGGFIRPYSNLFYWAYAAANVDSTIGLHPHQGFEIMSFVLKGQIRHYDTKLKEWRPLEAGDAQIIRAGNGIKHAEFMGKGSAMFQIWLDPNLGKTMEQPASYDDYKMDDLPVENTGGVSVRTYVGENSPFKLDTPGVAIERYEFEKADLKKELSTDQIYSMYVIDGNFSINGENVKSDDFIIIKEASELNIKSEESGKLFLISSPAKINYTTYAQMMQERLRA
ncbi:MAG: pirin family protein [Bacteroidota bacterium]